MEGPKRLCGPLDSEHAQEVDLIRHRNVRKDSLKDRDIRSVCVQYRIVILKQTGKEQNVCAASLCRITTCTGSDVNNVGTLALRVDHRLHTLYNSYTAQ